MFPGVPHVRGTLGRAPEALLSGDRKKALRQGFLAHYEKKGEIHTFSLFVARATKNVLPSSFRTIFSHFAHFVARRERCKMREVARGWCKRREVERLFRSCRACLGEPEDKHVCLFSALRSREGAPRRLTRADRERLFFSGFAENL